MALSSDFSPVGPANARVADAVRDRQLRAAAQELEATFLSEMLKHAGIGEVSDSFGGGEGEAQFASLLRDAQAREMAAAGGIGLAESIFTFLRERADGNGK
ncbi:rod-binding protein [Tropicimonas sp.]|uniref:rod-binding protein n=1 Tax=Tropicimonas sp. TaxID=2067044 RepID=UPI003A87C3C0